MNYKTLWPGSDAPKNINVIIEISAYSTPVKYEIDKHSNMLHVDRFLNTSMHYPCNYGYIPGTLSKDSDPIDVLVITPFPLQPSSVIACRPVGMLEMSDEKGIDRKILAVPTRNLTDLYDSVEDFNDLSKSVLQKIEHFFTHYKDLDSGKWSKVDHWLGLEKTWEEITEGTKEFLQNKDLVD